MNALYRCLGISKQAVSQQQVRDKAFVHKMRQILPKVDKIREAQPGKGLHKVYLDVAPDFIGRDRFINYMMELGYRVKRTPNHRRTTYAGKTVYPNLIHGLQVKAPSTVWQSDITYIQACGRHYYASFIIDVYTRNIVGYHLAGHMRATGNLQALKMALKNHKAPKIHHSDRGSQYGSKLYLSALKDANTKVSMGLCAQKQRPTHRNGTGSQKI